MRYAEGTTVPVERSRSELSRILEKNGVKEQGWHTSPEMDRLIFKLGGRSYMFTIVRPTVADAHRLFPNHRDTGSKILAEWRRRWRAQVMLLKMKLEFADGETTTLEREFMPNLIIDGSRTMADVIEQEGVEGLHGIVGLLESGR